MQDNAHSHAVWLRVMLSCVLKRDLTQGFLGHSGEHYEVLRQMLENPTDRLQMLPLGEQLPTRWMTMET